MQDKVAFAIDILNRYPEIAQDAGYKLVDVRANEADVVTLMVINGDKI